MDTLALAPSCHFLCPRGRCEKDKDGKVIKVGTQNHHIMKSSYCISSAEDEKIHHLHSLLCLNKEGDKGKFCGVCPELIRSNVYYRCNNCNEEYHKECVECPSMFLYSGHPKHQLQLLWYFDHPSFHRRDCFSCQKSFGNLFYYCSFCDFMVHPICTKNPIPLTINCRKRHKHTLHYFPRKPNMVCDVCAFERSEYTYICLLCDFVVHKQCMYLPYVIKVSRHNHRLTFSPNHPHVDWTHCGVCQIMIKGNYGHYSCMKGCTYGVHSRCAMRGDTCDGKELEGEPEETYENVEMVEEKGDGIIQHLSHPHHQMRLDKKLQRVYDENKRCQACILPVYDSGKVYRCMECDFVFHESCVYIPHVRDFLLHVHPLILEFGHTTSWVKCMQCDRYSCGFTYLCRQTCGLVLDTRCASICEPFAYHTHPHPLFASLEERNFVNCAICKSMRRQPLCCTDCDFVLCFGCATLPHKARYENDDHLLTFSYKNDANVEFYGCEICEESIYPGNGLYGCNECGVMIHIDCILGKDPYMKPGQSRRLSDRTIRVLPNIYSTRPICKHCKRRCPYKIKIESSRDGSFCSFDCYKPSAEKYSGFGLSNILPSYGYGFLRDFFSA